jgi:hypothetical protein
MKNKNIKRKIELIGQREKLGFSYNSNNGEISLESLPKSMEEAQSYSNFWSSFLEGNIDNIENVTFFYQENPTEIPLTNFQKFRNYFGAKIKPKEVFGDIKEYTTKPILISNESGLAKLISDKEGFDSLSKLSKTTKDFATRYVFTLKPLCYRTLIPLELITKMKLKENSN